MGLRLTESSVCLLNTRECSALSYFILLPGRVVMETHTHKGKTDGRTVEVILLHQFSLSVTKNKKRNCITILMLYTDE